MARKATKKTARAKKQISVQVAHLTKGMITIEVDSGSTVSAVLLKADIKSGADTFLNGKKCGVRTKVHAGDIIGVVTQVDGGR